MFMCTISSTFVSYDEIAQWVHQVELIWGPAAPWADTKPLSYIQLPNPPCLRPPHLKYFHAGLTYITKPLSYIQLQTLPVSCPPPPPT